ncbi:MAG TPA: GWxTD domain-containing protein [Thermoanaerobaculia bacterium]|jgi:GWxTD domain-containing protein
MRLIRLFAAVLVASAALPLLADANPVPPPSPRDWIKSPEAYFITTAEKNEWDLASHSDEMAKKFIEEYWRKRGTEFRSEVMARIEFADKNFGYAGIPGSRTPRGRVWMILGSPSTQKGVRPGVIGDADQVKLQNNSIEQKGRVQIVWTYRADRLPKELNLPSLTVTFTDDMVHGIEEIQNVGQTEPQLRRAAELFAAEKRFLPTEHSAALSIPKPAGTAGIPAEDPLWKAQENLGGTFVTAEPFISPKEETFYAVSFFIPKGDAAFANQKSVLFVGLVKNAEGQVVANLREQADLQPYNGDSGDRYVDRSLELPPGKYEGVFALFSPEGTTMLASRRAQFTVPEKSAPRASTVFLTSQINELEKQGSLDPFTFVATKYAVKGNRRFRTGEKIGFFTVVANPAGNSQPSMTMKMVVSKDGKVIDKTPPEPAPLTQTGPHTWLIGTQFDANTFKPGHYTIEVQLRDMKADKASEAYAKGYVNTAEFDVEQ